jgi:hypothetical protein
MTYEIMKSSLTPDEWRVEAIDTTTGDCYVALFSGPRAQQRAEEYAGFKNRQEMLAKRAITR